MFFLGWGGGGGHKMKTGLSSINFDFPVKLSFMNIKMVTEYNTI